MSRTVRSRLKMGGAHLRRDSYFLVVSFTSFVLYAICLYTFLHVNGYIGAKDSVAAASPRLYSQDVASEQQQHEPPFARSHVQFDDGKIHEFQHNVGQPVDWDMRVKAMGVRDIGEYLRSEREKREKVKLLMEQPGATVVPKRGPPKRVEHRKLLGLEDDDDQEDDLWPVAAARVAEPELSVLNGSRENVSEAEKPQPLFPEDLFTKEERQRGAVIFHIAGVVYMFVALAIVCDEFFVPSLDVIIEKLDIPDDVAGATFMAAGGSAPELFTSVIGVFVSFDDVGIGTIVGSAVFNILFVIGMCALFSKTVLTLTWWPLFRDCTFYSVSLIALVIFFTDNHIYWWEAGLLLGLYAAYVSFMRWNEQVERTVKRFLYRNHLPRISSTDHLVTNSARGPTSQASVSSNSGGGSTATTGVYPQIGSNAGGRPASAGIHRGSKFRHGLLQLMIHSIDPMHDGGHVDDKAENLHAIASLRVLLDATKTQTQGQGQPVSVSNGRDVVVSNQDQQQVPLPVRPPDREMTPVEAIISSELAAVAAKNGNNEAAVTGAAAEAGVASGAVNEANNENADEEENQPLDLSWPKGTRKRLTYIFLAPILFPLWLTLPDTRTPQGKRFFAVTFLGSIMWIAAFSYLMVWWANLTGDTVNIPPEVMGLTFLAAGTSIPDLITSVIVARKGLGDMAVSSSVGSNIFDICVGLPLPWFLYTMVFNLPVKVNSSGMTCSVLVLFGMLCFVVLSIACFRWKMNKALGITMFLFYFIFVAVSLGFEYGTLICPF